ncbi:MAG: ATP-binding protein [Leptospiraceae bacterium]|nr:ATP-binding protein [Leptospiraceae bacterium]
MEKEKINNIEKLQEKVAETVLVASGILILLIIFDDLVLGLYFIVLLKIPIIFILLMAYIKLKISGFKERYTHFVNLPIIIFFVFNYLGNQGTQGPTMYGVLTLFVTYPILLSRKWRWFYTILTLIVISILLYVGSDKTNLIISEYPNSMDQYQDHLFTFIAVATFLAILVTLVLDFYKKQNLELIYFQNKLHEQLALANSEKEKNETLLRILAHDVKSPINNLGELVELSSEDNLTNLEFKQFINGLKTRVNDLKYNIESILGNIKRNPESELYLANKITALDLTQKIVDESKKIFLNKYQNVSILSENTGSSPLNFDKFISEATIIIKNLLNNASKFSPSDSEIIVKLICSETELIWRIQDKAKKIPSEIESKLFKEAISSKNGSGVGLYLCQSIANNIGATLQYIPLDDGNCFEFKISNSI